MILWFHDSMILRFYDSRILWNAILETIIDILSSTYRYSLILTLALQPYSAEAEEYDTSLAPIQLSYANTVGMILRCYKIQDQYSTLWQPQ